MPAAQCRRVGRQAGGQAGGQGAAGEAGRLRLTAGTGTALHRGMIARPAAGQARTPSLRCLPPCCAHEQGAHPSSLSCGAIRLMSHSPAACPRLFVAWFAARGLPPPPPLGRCTVVASGRVASGSRKAGGPSTSAKAAPAEGSSAGGGAAPAAGRLVASSWALSRSSASRSRRSALPSLHDGGRRVHVLC